MESSTVKQAGFIIAAILVSLTVSGLTTFALWKTLPAKVVVNAYNYTIEKNIAPQTIIIENVSKEMRLEDRVSAAIKTAEPSVVHISLAYYKGKVKYTAVGSGFIATAEGHLLTNAHVVEDIKQVTVVTADGSAYNGSVISIDAETDLAVVKIEPNTTLTPAAFGDSDNITLGQFVLAVGSPYRLSNTVTLGVISGLNRTYQTDAGSRMHEIIQTDTAINPGNSGGPLVDLDGRVIGVNTAVISKSGGFEGIGFAIPINTAKKIAFELIENGKVTRPWMGITLRTLTPESAETLNMTIKEGVLILDVVNDSPAYKAGLQGTLVRRDLSQVIPGDVITRIDGLAVRNADELIDVLGNCKPGQEIIVEYYRRGASNQTSLVLGEKP